MALIGAVVVLVVYRLLSFAERLSLESLWANFANITEQPEGHVRVGGQSRRSIQSSPFVFRNCRSTDPTFQEFLIRSGFPKIAGAKLRRPGSIIR